MGGMNQITGIGRMGGLGKRQLVIAPITPMPLKSILQNEQCYEYSYLQVSYNHPTPLRQSRIIPPDPTGIIHIQIVEAQFKYCTGNRGK